MCLRHLRERYDLIDGGTSNSSESADFKEMFYGWHFKGKSTIISLIAKKVGINKRECKSCKINKWGGWNKRGGWDFLGKKLVHNSNKWGVEGGKNLRNQ